MLEQMEKYVQSVLPDGMPQRKREPLHDELLCHLLDRYEFYRGKSGLTTKKARKKRFTTWAKTKITDGNVYYRIYTETGTEKHKIELQK